MSGPPSRSASRAAPLGGADAEALRGKLRKIDAGDFVRYRAVAQERRGEPRGGRRSLDTVAALSGKPEEARQDRIEADHRRAVRCEGPEPRPALAHAPDPQIRHVLDAVDRRG